MSGESASAIQRNQVDLVDFIDWTGVECLNQISSQAYANALKKGYREDDGLNLESDADEQLLIYIPFTQVIKLHSIAIKGFEEEGPKTVKLYSNKEHMGFSNVNDYPPNDTLTLSSDDIAGKPVALKYVKFQNVRSLTVFVEDNQSESEKTKVQKIILYGTTFGTIKEYYILQAVKPLIAFNILLPERESGVIDHGGNNRYERIEKDGRPLIARQ